MTDAPDNLVTLDPAEIARVAGLLLDTLKQREPDIDTKLACAALMRTFISILPHVACEGCRKVIFATAISELNVTMRAAIRTPGASDGGHLH